VYYPTVLQAVGGANAKLVCMLSDNVSNTVFISANIAIELYSN